MEFSWIERFYEGNNYFGGKKLKDSVKFSQFYLRFN